MATPTQSAGSRAVRARRRRPVASGEVRAAWLFVTPALVVVVLLRFLPVVKGVVQSFVVPAQIGPKTTIGFGNYTFLFNNFPEFYKSVITTLVLVVISVALQTACAAGLAVLLAGPRRGNAVVRTLLLLPLAAPIAAATAVWGILLLPSGPINAVLHALGLPMQPFLTSSHQALICVVIILSWGLVGYWTTILVAGLHDIPRDLYEAAALDAAPRWRTFRDLTLPLLRRPLLFVVVAGTIVDFLAFAPSQILTSGGPEGSTNVLIYEIFTQAFTNQDMGLASAELTLCLVALGGLVAMQFRLLGKETV